MSTARRRGLRFVKRVYPARMVGMALSLIAIGAVFSQLSISPLLWVLLTYNGLIWPHLAYLIAVRSDDPYRFERIHLMGDSLVGGFWLVAMDFNPVAGCAIVMMIWMNNIAAGGLYLFALGVVSTFVGIGFGLLIVGFQWFPAVTPGIIYAAIPMIVGYPILIGSITYRLSMQLHQQKELQQFISRRDGLTGIFNRSYWEVRAKEEIVRVRRNHNPLSLLMIDVDHFKRVNDTYGHSMGDYVLQQIAQHLQWNLREFELLGRYGGEEFAIILIDEDANSAKQTAERLREAIEQLVFIDPADPQKHQIQCTISVGIASYNDGAGDYSSWIRAADAALYKAKRSGRNTCVSYQSTGPSLRLESQ
jgi:diguanylate cyclase